MAKPDTDDGWLKYAHELDAALACADWSKGARIVLKEVFAQIFGPAKLKVAHISITEIGRRYGILKQNVSRAVKELIDGGALVKVEAGTFRFAKDYEKWTHNGAPRFSETELSAIHHAPVIARSYKSVSGISSDNSGVSVQITNGIDSDNSGLSKLIPKVIDSDNSGVSVQITSPLIKESRTLSIENLREKGEGENGALPPVASLGKEYTDVGFWAEDFCGDCSWAPQVLRWGKIGHPAPWIKKAIERASVAGVLTIKYVDGILQGYHADGGPTDRKSSKGPSKPKLETKPWTPEDEAKRKAFHENYGKQFEGTKVINREPKPEPAPIPPSERPKPRSREEQLAALKRMKQDGAK